jgi:pyruvate ferredoxin oxidoreductase alpha subunit
MIEPYKCEDAEYVTLTIGSTAGTMKAAVDELRNEGHKVGAVKLKVLRPFPAQKLREVMAGKKCVAVMDRHLVVGVSGPVFLEVAADLMDLPDCPKLVNYVYGLGGRDVRVDDLKQVYMNMIEDKQDKVNYLGVKL